MYPCHRALARLPQPGGFRMAADRRLGWGFIGASAIAEDWMAPAVRADPDSRLVAVMSRDIARARDFAARHGIPRAHARGGGAARRPGRRHRLHLVRQPAPPR